MKRLNLDTNTSLTADSNILASSQKAVKAYADTKLKNTATGTNSLTVEGTATSSDNATNIGKNSSAATDATAIGYNALASAQGSIQIGNGTNSTANTTQIGNYPVLDASGTIVSNRLPFATDTTKGGVIIEFDPVNGILNIRTE